MSNVLSSEVIRLCESLYGHLEYYETILGKDGLIFREAEFRSYKLGLTVGLLRIVEIPEELKRRLTSKIIESWRLDVPENSLEQRSEEMEIIQRNMEKVRSAMNWTETHASPIAARKLSSAVMLALPLMPSDIKSEDIPEINNLLSQIMDYFATIMSGRSIKAQSL